MGLLYTTEGTRRVIDTLNTAFGPEPGSGLDYIRARMRGDTTIDGYVRNNRWRLARFAYVFQIYPASQASTQPIDPASLRKWWFFLRATLAPVHNQIRDALTEAIVSANFSRVAFDHVESGVTPRPQAVIFDAQLRPPSATPLVRHVTLITEAVGGSDNDAGQPDPNEPNQQIPTWRYT